jgi:hypothetical protein
MSSFVTASSWLSERLNQGEIAVVPTPEVFETLKPNLQGRIIDYQSIWNSAGVGFRERADPNKIKALRIYFVNLLITNSSIKYVVRDWVDPYAQLLFENNDELVATLKEVEVIPFRLSTSWSSQISIFESVRYAPLPPIDLRTAPISFHTHPTNVNVTFGLDGALIHKDGPQAGFYLELKPGINSSRQSYSSAQFELDLENANLTLTFYYDANHDGIFSGYDSVDYVRSGIFSQKERGWVKGKWYTIYQGIPVSNDPVVQIGIILNGDQSGTLTFAKATVYQEV